MEGIGDVEGLKDPVEAMVIMVSSVEIELGIESLGVALNMECGTDSI